MDRPYMFSYRKLDIPKRARAYKMMHYFNACARSMFIIDPIFGFLERLCQAFYLKEYKRKTETDHFINQISITMQFSNSFVYYMGTLNCLAFKLKLCGFHRIAKLRAVNDRCALAHFFDLIDRSFLPSYAI